MEIKVLPVRIARSGAAYDISIGAGLLEDAGSWAASALGARQNRILIISNAKVYGLYGRVTSASLRRAGFAVSTHLIGDGEKFKSLETLEETFKALGQARFNRTDAVLALGGGVIGDLAGFAASVYMRGIDFLQVPTTLLSMIDSSVGGKTAVNTSFGKNMIGSFYQPRGVLIDAWTLRTLPARELTAGLCEAVKQGAVSGTKLFRQTGRFLEEYSVQTFRSQSNHERFVTDLRDLLASQISFKAEIVQNDEKESISNRSSRSRKILNFGHTFAHALEKATNYRRFRHGEAVGYGIRFAAELSKKLELIGQDEVDSLNDVVHRAGALPAIGNIDPSAFLEAFTFDKKQIGDSLHWVLLRGIGKPVIVPSTDIPRSVIRSTLRKFIRV